MLVNRTAVFHIGRAVVAALALDAPTLQYFGERMVSPPSAEASERLKSKLAAAIADPTGFEKAWLGQAASRSSTSRRVFLDPLYVLFSNLCEEDMVLMHDLSPLTTPAWHEPPVAQLYQHAFNKITRISPRLLSVSNHTAQTYYANFGYTRRPIEVVHLFVPEHLEVTAARLHPARPYFLFVGSLEARKNVAGAIRAFALSGLAQQGFDLLIVGGGGHGSEAARRLGRETPNVVFCDFVGDSLMSAFYGGATGFVYPSYLEGFGVPLLEALHRGIPAVASTTGACQEVGGDLVAYCGPDDHVAIAQQLGRIAAMGAAERGAFAASAKRRVAEHFGLASFQARIRSLVTAA